MNLLREGYRRRMKKNRQSMKAAKTNTKVRDEKNIISIENYDFRVVFFIHFQVSMTLEP